MRVLITGGAGYIGTELVYALEKLDGVNEIVVYDNFSRKNFNLFIGKTKLTKQKVRFVQGDILDSRKLETEIEKANVIYHLAAKVTTPFADHSPHQFDQINNWGTAELSYLIEKHSIERLIYTSSTSVYGASDDLTTIKSDTNPKTFYGNSKLQGENHIAQILNTKVYTLRLGNVYGYSKSMRFDSVINKFIFEANYNRKVHILGDGNQTRSFIHIDRLTNCLVQMLSSELNPTTYNLVENTYTVNEIVDVLKEIYPNLEMVFVNQNSKMRSLSVEKDERLINCFQKKVSLTKDLLQFKSELSF